MQCKGIVYLLHVVGEQNLPHPCSWNNKQNILQDFELCNTWNYFADGGIYIFLVKIFS